MYRIFRNVYEVLPNTYNFFRSTVKLSSQRKQAIEERRGQLKSRASDPKILCIVIEEMLAYKPGLLTLDDRYLQLERILDAIDEARKTGETANLLDVCENITQQLQKISDSVIGINVFLRRLESIHRRAQEEGILSIQAKL